MQTTERPIGDLMQLRGHGTAGGHNEAVALLMLLDEESLSMSELGARVPLSRAAMTSMADRFERRGHLRRIPHPDDRRVIMLELTELGKVVVSTALTTPIPKDTAA